MTELSMDIDDLKLAWQSLDRKLERHNALAFQQFKDGRVKKARARLRPLYWGQMLQIPFGLALLVLGVSTWTSHWEVVHLRVAGLSLHAYGLAVMVAGGRTLWLISQIDYSAPVVTIQAQLAQLGQWFVRSGAVAGNAWWLMWMPFVMALGAAVGVDMFVRAPRMFVFGTIQGLAGLLLMSALYWLSARPGWEWLAKLNDNAGTSLRRAQAAIDEVRQFEDGETTSSVPALAD
jgi:hypothetical protein